MTSQFKIFSRPANTLYITIKEKKKKRAQWPALLTGLIAECEAAAAVGFAPTSPSDSTPDSTLIIDCRDSIQKVKDDR